MKEHPTLDIPIKLDENVTMPTYASGGASGADIRAHIEQEIILVPGRTTLVPTGIRVAIPLGYEMQVRPRSGLALKHGIFVLNTPGTVDADYRGELKIILCNLGQDAFTITPGMRIAQLVITPVVQAHFIVQEELCSTARGAGGFGHTGTH